MLVLAATIPAYATDQYEYNDYNLYQVGGGGVASGAFRSNSSSLSSFYIIVSLGSQNNPLWAISQGSFSSIPTPSNYSLDYNNFSSWLKE